MAPGDILISCDANLSVYSRSWTLFTPLFPAIQSLLLTVRSDVWFANEFFWTGSFWWMSWTSSPNRTELSETVHGLSSSDLKVTQTNLNFGRISSHSFNAPVSSAVTEPREEFWLGPKTDEPLIWAPSSWMKGLNYIYIYAFSKNFYPKQLTVHSGYTFFCISLCVPW